MTIQEELDRLGPWYHSIKLPDGTVTPGWNAIANQWENVRSVRAGIEYTGKRVLDVGTRDGMWAFEAEEMGASAVVAIDIGDEPHLERFLWVKQMKKSRIVPYFNVPVESLGRLDCFFKFNPGRFDIVQHLGVLYHLEDPIRSLRQCRSIVKTGGVMLLETAVFAGGDDLPVALFNCDSNVYDDPTTFWALNEKALGGALALCGFKARTESVRFVEGEQHINRVCLIADAV